MTNIDIHMAKWADAYQARNRRSDGGQDDGSDDDTSHEHAGDQPTTYPRRRVWVVVNTGNLKLERRSDGTARLVWWDQFLGFALKNAATELVEVTPDAYGTESGPYASYVLLFDETGEIQSEIMVQCTSLSSPGTTEERSVRIDPEQLLAARGVTVIGPPYSPRPPDACILL